MSENDQAFSTAIAEINVAELRSGRICVRPAARQLEIDGRIVGIERRAFDLLVYLMRNPDRVVDKDELLREVWHSRPVSESALPQAVSRIRRLLGDGAEDCLATVYGVGYRFSGSVEVVEADGIAARASGGGQVSARRISLILIGLAVVLLSAWAIFRVPENSVMRIALLPVQNETGDAQLDWVQLGVLPLIDRALEDGGVRRVRTSQVLSTLRRYPDADAPQAQARVLKLNTSADRVLVPRLYVADSGYRLEVGNTDADAGRLSFDIQGDDLAVLAVAAGTTLSQSQARSRGAARERNSLVTDDPFVNEAFMRGLDAQLRGRWEDAARFFDTVLAAAPDLLDAKYHLAQVTRHLGDWDYTGQLHEELIEAARVREDRGMLAAAQSLSGTLAWRRGDPGAAARWYQQALDNYGAQGDADDIASTTGNLGILAAISGDLDLAEKRMRRTLAHYRSSGDRFNQARMLKNIGKLMIDQGRPDEAEKFLLDSLEIRRTLELPLEVALTLSVLGDVEMARGHWEQAMAYQRRVLAAAEEYDSPLQRIHASSDLSKALRRLGRLEEAVRRAADAHAMAVELGSRSNQAFALLQQGRVEYDRRRLQRAGVLFEQAVSVYAEVQEPLGEALARIALAETLAAQARTEQAERQLAAARQLASDSQIEQLDGLMSIAQAAVLELKGDEPGKLAALQAAYEHARQGESRIDVLDTGGLLGQALIEHRGDPGRIAVLAEELGNGADISASALAFLARFHRDGDPDRALALAERRRDLVGEGWTRADERELEALRTRANTQP